MNTVSISKYKGLYAYITFLVWPLFAVLYAIVNVKASYTKNIIWLFCAFFGYTFIVSNPEMDANRYQEHLYRLAELRHIPFFQALIEPYANKGIYSGTDIYGHLITLIVSRFTNDFRILFALVGFIYGYFYSRNVFYVLEFVKNKKLKILAVSSLLLLAFILPFWNINGYRFYTAAHIFLFGALRILVERKYKYLLICFITPLVHFSFLFPLGVLLIYLLLGNRYFIYIPLLLVSLLFTDIDPATINENAALAPVFMQNKVSGYTRGEYVDFAKGIYTGMNWYVLGHIYALNVCLYLSIFYLFLKRKAYLKDDIAKSLFSFGVLFLALANFVITIPSMGRFQAVALPIIAVVFIYCIQQGVRDKWIKRFNYIFIPVTIFFLIVEIRIGFDFIGFNSLLLNPMTAPFFPDSSALIDYIK
jgi:EpsG family